jgi:hypothetical protein
MMVHMNWNLYCSTLLYGIKILCLMLHFVLYFNNFIVLLKLHITLDLLNLALVVYGPLRG